MPKFKRFWLKSINIIQIHIVNMLIIIQLNIGSVYNSFACRNPSVFWIKSINVVQIHIVNMLIVIQLLCFFNTDLLIFLSVIQLLEKYEVLCLLFQIRCGAIVI